LLIAAIVVAATNVFEYAVDRKVLGGFWTHWFSSPGAERLGERMLSPQFSSLVRLPMTIASLAVLISGTWLVVSSRRQGAGNRSASSVSA
jgi:hypothetical protein